jgi:polyvinyl alcohol dehydrogenase (cytochrome)
MGGARRLVRGTAVWASAVRGTAVWGNAVRGIAVRGIAACVLLAPAVACSGGDEGAAGSEGGGSASTIDECDWPTWGRTIERSFSYDCRTALGPETVGGLRQRWFFGTDDAVTATPAVVDGTVYVGDWSGRFYAIDLESGRLDWSFTAEPHARVYAGQIVGSAAVADVDGTRTVYVPSGETVFALRADDGELLWERALGRPEGDDDPTEIESSPAVADGLVIIGTDVHNSDDGTAAGVHALDARNGARRWSTTTAPTTGEGGTGPGCADVWGSPSVDLDRRLVFVGTGNCVTEQGWGDATEALLALDLDTGDRVWTFQPHEQNLSDLDFAGAPNLFETDGRDVVGLGNKDAAYYVVDRATGELVWRTQVADPGLPEEGQNFSFGGFIGPTAYAGGLVVGGTAVGGDPYLHALDGATGEIVWQQREAGPTFAATLEANGVVYLGGTDYTLRAVDLRSGDVLWSQSMQGAVAGGAVVVGDDLVAVAGMREPGSTEPNETAGVYSFSLPDPDDSDDFTTSTTATPADGTEPSGPIDPAALAQDCVAAPCQLDFTLTAERVGGQVGTGTLHLTAEPFRLVVEAEGLGDPARWLRPGSAAARAGASQFAVFMSQGTDDPVGGLACVLDGGPDGDLTCATDEIPNPGTAYDRISILAVDDPGEFPPIAEGFDRMVTTNALDVPFAPRGG